MNILVFILVIICLIAANLCFIRTFFRSSFYRRLEEWLKRDEQYRIANTGDIDHAIYVASYYGKRTSFLQYLIAVRTRYGHPNVTVGHLEWIHENIGKGIALHEITEIPSFVKTNSGQF